MKTIIAIWIGVAAVVYAVAQDPPPDQPHVYDPTILLAAKFFASQEHGPTVECKQWCSPDGERHEAPDGMPVVKCAGGGGSDSCAAHGRMCGEEHQAGCSEYCRRQCCSCCSI